MSDLINRQAAIDAMAQAIWHYPKELYQDLNNYKNAEELAKRGLSFISSTEPEWIPCSERLPEEGRYYVTRFDYVTNMPFLDLLWFEKGVWWDRLHPGNYAVIAWMPLPEPYQEDEE